MKTKPQIILASAIFLAALAGAQGYIAVESIDFISTMSDCRPWLIAITAEP